MGLIRRADAELIARDAVVLDLGRVEQQRDALVADARAKAAQIVEEARRERENLIKDAASAGRKTGMEEGLRKGLEQGRTEGREEAIREFRDSLNLVMQAWTEALEQFAARRESMLLDARRDVVHLACQIASRATGRLVQTDPSLVEHAMAEVLSLVAGPTRLRVRIHPEDEPILHDALPQLLQRMETQFDVELIRDEQCSRGSCIAITERQGLVDASVNTRLDRLVASILGEAPA
ncbi:MAG: hypothetical protein DYG94_08975 [Leptolyngbya sp. PLA3]|nr:MAG: hypothetical protein EDM82_02820 [Cyanobacteria bacterium CYA]MCE7968863.1 hypothetical protein [Leptolyngbya sp. PL-A3]